jgi:DeoR/GlpR family transcriptional regulator of sugar metabolism
MDGVTGPQTRSSVADRRQALTEYLLQVGSAHPQELADRFGVSLVTMHRDLDELARQELLRKFHGRVTARPVSEFEDNFSYRSRLAVTEKQAIARLAADSVEPGMTVLLDDSTTTFELAKVIADIEPLTVITNFQPVISLFQERPHVQLVALGGEYSAAHGSFTGTPCIVAAGALHADLGFYSFGGVSDGQAYHQDHMIVLTKQAMLQVASRRILLADHLKLGRSALHRVTGLDAFEQLITDDGADDDVLAGLREYGPHVRVAKLT